jgi:hypothetical protein
MKHIKLYESMIGQAEPKGEVTEAQMNAQSEYDRISKISTAMLKFQKDAKRIADGNPDAKEVDAMTAITDCIKDNNFTHLAFLTTGAGSYALGIITALTCSGVGTAVGLGLGFVGMCIVILDAYLGDVDSTSVTQELEELQSCLKGKGLL